MPPRQSIHEVWIAIFFIDCGRGNFWEIGLIINKKSLRIIIRIRFTLIQYIEKQSDKSRLLNIGEYCLLFPKYKMII
jgi:hypothetical protein